MALILVEEVRILWTGRFEDSEYDSTILGLFSNKENARSECKPRKDGKVDVKYKMTSLDVDENCLHKNADIEWIQGESLSE